MLEQTSIDIGRYARVPYHIAIAKISSRARDVWILLAMNCSPENPEVWVRQATLADQLDCSTDTTSRATQELVKTRLLLPTQKWHQGRHKIYRLIWEEACCKNTVPRTAELQDNLPQKCVTSQLTCRTNAVPPAADLRVDVPQKCGPLNRILINQEQNIIFSSFAKASTYAKASVDKSADTEKILADYGEIWKKRFACLDGLSGRPSVEECVEQALNHSARDKAKDLRIYVDMWLRNAAKQWLSGFNREQNAPPTDPSLGSVK